MDRKYISMTIAIAVVCFVAGYWLALPGHRAVAPENGVQVNAISIRDASSSDIYVVTGEYPQFGNVSAAMNGEIAGFVDSNLSQFKASAAENWQARLDTMPTGTVNTLPPQSFYFSSSWEPEQINGRYVSAIVRIDYFDGGANDTELLKTFNYDVAGGRELSLTDLFPNVPDVLPQISQLAIEQLTDSEQSASNGSAESDMIQSGAAPTADNYANFTFNDDVVTIYFPKYQVAPGAFGEQKVTIARSALQ